LHVATHAKYPIGVAQEIETLGSRYGLTVIEREGDRLRQNRRFALAELLSRNNEVAKFWASANLNECSKLMPPIEAFSNRHCRRLSCRS